MGSGQEAVGSGQWAVGSRQEAGGRRQVHPMTMLDTAAPPAPSIVEKMGACAMSRLSGSR